MLINPSSPSIPSARLDSKRKSINTSIFFMSSNIQSIIDAALADYTKFTGTDLSKTPFATALKQQSNSPGVVLQLLQDRAEAFKEYREGNRKLVDCLSPAVNILQAFSGIIGSALSLVSHICHRVVTLFNSYLVRSRFHQQALCLLESACFLRYVPPIRSAACSPVICKYVRLPEGFHRAMMRCSSCSSAWGTSSSDWRSIRRFLPLQK